MSGPFAHGLRSTMATLSLKISQNGLHLPERSGQLRTPVGGRIGRRARAVRILPVGERATRAQLQQMR